MDTKKIVLTVVCVLVIAGAVVYTIKKQGPQTGPPKDVLEAKADYVCAKCGATETMSEKDYDALPQDSATGYHKCPKCGEMGLARVAVCPWCHAKIPAAPANANGNYPCPKCGKNALVPPGAPEVPTTTP